MRMQGCPSLCQWNQAAVVVGVVVVTNCTGAGIAATISIGEKTVACFGG
jgi:hypothetical protein